MWKAEGQECVCVCVGEMLQAWPPHQPALTPALITPSVEAQPGPGARPPRTPTVRGGNTRETNRRTRKAVAWARWTTLPAGEALEDRRSHHTYLGTRKPQVSTLLHLRLALIRQGRNTCITIGSYILTTYLKYFPNPCRKTRIYSYTILTSDEHFLLIF